MDSNNRQYPRFSTDVKVHFYVPYDLETKIDFQIEDSKGFISASKRYTGETKNISAGGLCIASDVELEKGTRLYMELSLPNEDKIITMEGDVRWCAESETSREQEREFYVGVQLDKIQGKTVDDSIYFDEQFNVIWSEVLETVLGSFAKLHKKVY